MNPAEFVKRCREYESKATNGPWQMHMKYVSDEGTMMRPFEHVRPMLAWDSEHPEVKGGTRFESYTVDDDDYIELLDDYSPFPITDNAKFCVNARQDLPAALSLIEQLVQERDALAKRVKELEATNQNWTERACAAETKWRREQDELSAKGTP